jgi:hypothetical protein
MQLQNTQQPAWLWLQLLRSLYRAWYDAAWAYFLAGVALDAGGKVGSLVSRLHQSPNDARHLRENQDMVVRVLQVCAEL